MIREKIRKGMETAQQNEKLDISVGEMRELYSMLTAEKQNGKSLDECVYNLISNAFYLGIARAAE